MNKIIHLAYFLVILVTLPSCTNPTAHKPAFQPYHNRVSLESFNDSLTIARQQSAAKYILKDTSSNYVLIKNLDVQTQSYQEGSYKNSIPSQSYSAYRSDVVNMKVDARNNRVRSKATRKAYIKGDEYIEANNLYRMDYKRTDNYYGIDDTNTAYCVDLLTNKTYTLGQRYTNLCYLATLAEMQSGAIVTQGAIDILTRDFTFSQSNTDIAETYKDHNTFTYVCKSYTDSNNYYSAKFQVIFGNSIRFMCEIKHSSAGKNTNNNTISQSKNINSFTLQISEYKKSIPAVSSGEIVS